jgi:hypothetical protein
VALSEKSASWTTTDVKRQQHWHTEAWGGSLTTLRDLLSYGLPFTKPFLALSPSLARHWLQTPPPGVSSLSELHSVVSVRAQQLFGAALQLADTQVSGWHVSGSWQASTPFVCTAWPAALSPLGLSLCTPLFIALQVYQSRLPRNGWLAITLAHELHLMQITNTQITFLRSTRLPLELLGAELQDRLVQEWQRDALRTNEQAKQVNWLHLMPNNGNTAHHPAVIRVALYPITKSSATEQSSLALDDANEAQVALWAISEMMGGNS